MITLNLNLDNKERNCGSCDAFNSGFCEIFTKKLPQNGHSRAYEKLPECKVASFNFPQVFRVGKTNENT